MDNVWLVLADMEKRINRVMQRDLASREEVLKRIQRQMNEERMKQYADEIIENNGSIIELHDRISAILSKSQYKR